MRTIVVGGGKVGGYLGRALTKEGHTVTVIEASKEKARRLADLPRLLVIIGDGTEVEVLNKADAARSDWVVAVTGKDEDNLVACQLARTLGARHVIARLNDPMNAPTFSALEIPVVAVTDMIVRVISHEVQIEAEQLERVTLLARGELSLVEVDIPDGTPVRRVSNASLPGKTVLVALLRNDEVFIPHGDTELRPGDRVLAVTKLLEEEELRAALAPGGSQ
jgi:trk system potassium uptake protein TrkA